jgi:hypothetical protein
MAEEKKPGEEPEISSNETTDVTPAMSARGKKAAKKKKKRSNAAAAGASIADAGSGTTGRRAFEVNGTINLGRKNGVAEIRTQGDTVYEDELGPDMIRYLLDRGEIADRNAPIPPSQADKALAFDHLVDVATRVGAIEVNGSEYSVDDGEEEKVYRGILELRKALTIDRLKELIVEAAE